MDKSQCLDELRMEVGLVGDYAQSLTEFYHGVITSLGQRLKKDYAVALYLADGYRFQLMSSSGNVSEDQCERFGDGPLSLCAIRGETILHKKRTKNQIITPFYSGHHLRGLLMAEFPCLQYQITEEDLIFMNEVSRFIEKNYQRFVGFSESF